MTARRFLIGAFVAALAALALAAPAQAAPTLTLEKVCDRPGNPFLISMSLSGLAPNQQFSALVTTPNSYWGPVSLTADANGVYGPFVIGEGQPTEFTVTVTVDGVELTKSLAVTCEDFITGGSVVGEGDVSHRLDGENVPLHFTIDGTSGVAQDHPGGTVTARFAGYDLHGSITCVAVYGGHATVGVAIDDPPTGISRGQIWIVSDHFEDALGIQAADEPPTECPAPGSLPGGNLLESGGITVRTAVPDTEPPSPAVPELAVINATRRWGTEARYVVSATDDVDPRPTVGCSVARGTPIPVGLTKITCDASDYSGNTATRLLRLVVRGGPLQLEELRKLVVGWGLDTRTDRRLVPKLDAAVAALRRDRKARACSHLADFIHAARRESGAGLTQHQAGRALADATRIRGALGCTRPPPPATVPTIRVAPECGEETPDVGQLGYGASVRLAGFDPGTRVRLEIDTGGWEGLALEETVDANGSYGPWVGSLADPVGLVTVTALESENGPVLATATLGDPCLAPVWQP